MTVAWVTAVVGISSFLLGVVVPFVYKRFSHEGYSVREVPWAGFGAIALTTGDEDVRHGVFGVVKTANGSADPILIEGLRIGPLSALFEDVSKSGASQSLYLRDVDRDRPIVFPPVDADLYRWATLPLILEPQTERELALWLNVEFDDEGRQHRPMAYPKPIDLVWSVSGKSRKLKVTPTAMPMSLSMEVAVATDGDEVLPIQLFPPGAVPSKLPPSAALGLRAGARVNALDLSGIDLVDARLDGASLNDVKLDRAKMAGVSLRESKLNSVTLADADLVDARLDGAYLNDVKLDRAKMAGVSLRESRLNSVTLADADLSRACLAGARVDDARFTGAQLVAANMDGFVGNAVDMADANASEANLVRAELPHANLKRIDLSRADLRWANLSGASLVDADLSCAKLHGADLSGADLSGAALPPACRDQVHSDVDTLWPGEHAT